MDIVVDHNFEIHNISEEDHNSMLSKSTKLSLINIYIKFNV